MFSLKNYGMKRYSIWFPVLFLPLLAFAGTASLPSARVLLLAGAPVAGTNEIQTITFGSGQSSGNFFLRFNNRTTASIAWSATNGTLVSNIDTAIEALSNVGVGGCTTAVGTMTAGIGTITVTFTGANAKSSVPTMTVPSKTTSGTIDVTETTPGVTADGRSSPLGSLLVDSTNHRIYQNQGSPPNPNFVQLVPAP